jgi:predicted O-linked N-acetylglucosamine transferase (SPINDLY family)
MKPIKELSRALGRAISSEPTEIHPATVNSTELSCALGEQRLKEGRPELALGFFQQAVKLDPGSVHGWFGQGMAYTNMEEFAASLEYFRKAIDLDPTVAISHHNLGRSLHETGQADLAYRSFQKSLNLGFEATRKEVAIFIPGCPSASNRTVLDERRKWADSLLKSSGGKQKKYEIKRDTDKHCLRVGYVSAFFHKDNWMKVPRALIGQHDREKFQIHLFSDRTKLTPAIQKHLQPGDQFHDLSNLSNDEAAAAIANLEIDILVDLNGHSYPQRFPLFSHKPAPLVVAWFNVYATTGFDCFDYLIGDDCVIPESEEPWYCEKIARMEGSYLAFGVPYDVPEVTEPPCIANGFVTFGSLISQYKITEYVIDAWCGILNNTPGSRLLIRNAALGKRSNRQFLRSQFINRGIADERLSLEGPAAHFEFLETYNRIDIALDAFPYNGGTTTIESIWQGVPVVTFWGDRWVSRTSATLLLATGLDELLAKDLPGYIQLATQLAGDPQKLKTMRQNMRDRVLASEACDTVSFARSMEKLYREIWENQQDP